MINTSDAVVITLNNVNINTSAGSAIDCGSSGKITLVLHRENKCVTTNGDAAAIRVVSGAALEIKGDGSLKASNGSNGACGAGIGGNGGETGESCGAVTISGGTVTASSYLGAGIGGGYGISGNGGASGTVTISGGTVTASSESGAGIGGGYAAGGDFGFGFGGSGGTATISGGLVIAKSNIAECIGGGGHYNGHGPSGAFDSLTLGAGMSCSLGNGINYLGAATKYAAETEITTSLGAKCAYIVKTGSAFADLTGRDFSVGSDYDRQALLTLFNFGWKPVGKTINCGSLPLFETNGGTIKNAVIKGTAAIKNGNVAAVANDLPEGSELNGVAVFATVNGSSTDATALSCGGFAASCKGSIKNSLCTLTFSDGVSITTYYDKDGNPSVIEGVENITKTLNDNLIGGSKWNMVTVTDSVSDGQTAYRAGDSVTIGAGTKTGNPFKHWNATGVTLENNEQNEITFTMPENDVQLTPAWTYYSLTVSGTEASDEAAKHEVGSSVTLSAGTKTGCKFSHWDATGVTLADDTPNEITFTMPENNAALTACWEYYSVTVTGTEASDGETKHELGSSVTLSAGTKTGYAFLRWEATGIALAGRYSEEITFDMPDNDVQLTAVWTKVQQYNPSSSSYTLTFDTNGGEAIAPLSASVYSYINLESYIPTKVGDTFDGWYQDSTLKNKITVVSLGCDTTVYAKWRGGSMDNFKLAGEYFGYIDVNDSAWYAEDCRNVTMLGLMRGTSVTERTFSPTASITLAEVIKLASVISRTYSGISPAELEPDVTWYAPYVKYAIEAGIISASDFGGVYTRTATRAETAYILANALPASEYAKISELTPPDVADTDAYSAEINLLYAAGILRGTDGEGAFKGGNTLTRAEAAAICVRICLPDKRG